MAKRKPFHAQMAAVVARDMRPFFSMEEIKNSLFEQELPGIGLCESGTSFLDERFPTLQEEAHFISSFEQSHTITDDDPSRVW